jgi:hypothetical protein
MNRVFRDQHIVGFGGLQIGVAADSCDCVAKSSVYGVTPRVTSVVAKPASGTTRTDAAYAATQTTHVHKGRRSIR